MEQVFLLQQKYRTIIVFLFSGGSAAFFQLLVYLFLSRTLALHYLVASSGAFATAVVVSFMLQKYVTFQDKGKEGLTKQFGYFVVLAVFNANANALLMYLFVEQVGLYDIFAQMTCMVTIALWSFFVYRHLIFKRV